MDAAEITDRRLRKQRDGVVVSANSDKTIVVRVERRVRHPLYGKEMTKGKRYHAHDEKNEAKVGDRVRIMETRPLSKLKHWRLVEVVEAATIAEA
jgi:small subunit ribosomal protein S17